MTTNTTIDRTLTQRPSAMQDTEHFSGKLYRFHGTRVFDRNGERVGIVDWIWTNEKSGMGDHIGVQLQWLRGQARAIPATGARIDAELGLVRLPFTKQQIMSAPRFRIERSLSSGQRAAIAAHFTPTAREEGSGSLSTPRAVRSIADAFHAVSFLATLGSQRDFS